MFEDDEIDPKLIKKGQKKPKVSSQKSILDNAVTKPSREEFEKRAGEVNDQLNSYRARMIELSGKFKTLLKNQTLPENKSQILKNMETEVMQDLVNLAKEINNDEYESEGEGSLGLIVLLINSFFHHRDKINLLEYTLAQQYKNYQDLQSKVDVLYGKVDQQVKAQTDGKR